MGDGQNLFTNSIELDVFIFQRAITEVRSELSLNMLANENCSVSLQHKSNRVFIKCWFGLLSTWCWINRERTLVNHCYLRASLATSFEDGRVGDRLPGSPKSQLSLFAGGIGSSYTLLSFGRANVAVAYHTDKCSVTGYVDNLLKKGSASCSFFWLRLNTI